MGPKNEPKVEAAQRKWATIVLVAPRPCHHMLMFSSKANIVWYEIHGNTNQPFKIIFSSHLSAHLDSGISELYFTFFKITNTITGISGLTEVKRAASRGLNIFEVRQRAEHKPSATTYPMLHYKCWILYYKCWILY